MKIQNNIKKQLAQPQIIDYIKSILHVNKDIHRTKLSELLCEEFDFYDWRGRKQIGTCLKALRDIEAKGHFSLPAPLKIKRKGNPRRLEHPVPEPKNVPAHVEDVKHLKLVKVETVAQMRVWNELIVSDHPQGTRPLVGRQLRYLIRSEHGSLGAIGFSSAALHLRARDSWIGWTLEQRKQYLDRIVCLSRFLIRPSVHCHNLASRVLGMCLRQLQQDFEHVYNYRLWLVETFVDTNRYRGTCYQASNWIKVGQSQGRGRQDSQKQSSLPRKDIYLYPLVNNFRQLMGLTEDAGDVPLEPTFGLTSDTWAENEFGRAELGDKRLTRRLVDIVRNFSINPGIAYTKASGGDRHAVKGFYRLIDTPEESPVTMKAIMQPHRDRTIRRMKSQSEVLVLHDGSDLNFATRIKCKGLGYIGKNQTQSKTLGLYLHTSFVTSPTGVPLGILKSDCRARKFTSDNKDKDLRYIPIEQKDSYQWIRDLRDCQHIAPLMPRTTVIYVADREADFFELFDQWRTKPNIQMLVRAQHNRRIEPENDEKLLFDAIKKKEPQGHIRVRIPRQSERPKKSKSKKKASPSRKATLSITYNQLRIRPTKYGLTSKNAPIPLWIIHVSEKNPPVDCDSPVDWFLLTTIPLTTFDRALQVVRYYSLRWRIEDWHRVIKSGCQIEKAQHATAERLRRLIAIKLIIAWRIMLMTLLAREKSTIPPDCIFTKKELKVLSCIQKKTT